MSVSSNVGTTGAHQGSESILAARAGLKPLDGVAANTPSTPVRVRDQISVQADMAGGNVTVETSNDGVTWSIVPLATGDLTITASGVYPICWQGNLLRFTSDNATNVVCLAMPGG